MIVICHRVWSAGQSAVPHIASVARKVVRRTRRHLIRHVGGYTGATATLVCVTVPVWLAAALPPTIMAAPSPAALARLAPLPENVMFIPPVALSAPAPQSVAVPEPSSLALMVAALTAGLAVAAVKHHRPK